MLNFSDVKEPAAPKTPKMSLRQYVEFCEFCAKSNSHISPETCLTHNREEMGYKESFRFPE